MWRVSQRQHHAFNAIYCSGKSYPSVWSDRILQLSWSTPSCASSQSSLVHLNWFYYLHGRMSYLSAAEAWRESLEVAICQRTSCVERIWGGAKRGKNEFNLNNLTSLKSGSTRNKLEWEQSSKRQKTHLYARWFRLGSIRASNSAKSLRNFDGSLSHVCVSRETAEFDIPITMAKNAFKFWYSLQLNDGVVGWMNGRTKNRVQKSG